MLRGRRYFDFLVEIGARSVVTSSRWPFRCISTIHMTQTCTKTVLAFISAVRRGCARRTRATLSRSVVWKHRFRNPPAGQSSGAPVQFGKDPGRSSPSS